MRRFSLPALPLVVLALTGCSEALSPIDQTLDFGVIHLSGEYVETATVTNQLFVAQTIVDAEVTGGPAAFGDEATDGGEGGDAGPAGAAFELLTAVPIAMDPEATYGLEFRFATPEEAGVFDELAVLTVERGDDVYEATIRLLAEWENGDLDGDGHVDEALGGDDCDDSNPAAHPGLDEVCDGFDTNCNGEWPESDVDEDGDGWLRCDGDCDDSDPTRHPEAEEACDWVDTDCDGDLGPDELDGDDDGYSACGGDCEPEVGTVHPGEHAEICDGLDTNCDGEIPEVEDDCPE